MARIWIKSQVEVALTSLDNIEWEPFEKPVMTRKLLESMEEKDRKDFLENNGFMPEVVDLQAEIQSLKDKLSDIEESLDIIEGGLDDARGEASNMEDLLENLDV